MSANGGKVVSPATISECEKSSFRLGSKSRSSSLLLRWAFFRTSLVSPRIGESIVRTLQGNGSSGSDGAYPGGNAGSPPPGKLALQAEVPAGVLSPLLTAKSSPASSQMILFSVGPGSRARKLADTVQDFSSPSAAIALPWPSCVASIWVNRKETELAPGSYSVTSRRRLLVLSSMNTLWMPASDAP